MINGREPLFEHSLLRRLRVGAGLSINQLAELLHCRADQVADVEDGRSVPTPSLRAVLEEWMTERLAPAIDQRTVQRVADASRPGMPATRGNVDGPLRRCAVETEAASAVSRARKLRDTRERALDEAMQLAGEAYGRANDLWFDRNRARVEGDVVRADKAGASAALMYAIAARHASAVAAQLAAAARLAHQPDHQLAAGGGTRTAPGSPQRTTLVARPMPSRSEHIASAHQAERPSSP